MNHTAFLGITLHKHPRGIVFLSSLFEAVLASVQVPWKKYHARGDPH